ncbi:hypothetical protein [Streptomyces sp. NPDC002746]
MPFTVELLAVPEAVPEMRRMLRWRFGEVEAPDLLLCVSELLTNVIVHVGAGRRSRCASAVRGPGASGSS